MFKELGQIMGLAKQLPKIKEEMERLQQRLAQVSAEGDAGAGMVKVRVNGKQEVVACTISEEAFKAGDREVLEEMVRGAVNQALDRVRKLAAEETSKMATNLGLPLGVGLPGMPPGLAGLPGGEEEG
jgi:DNA-binding YbaB/EbfC family protein